MMKKTGEKPWEILAREAMARSSSDAVVRDIDPIRDLERRVAAHDARVAELTEEIRTIQAEQRRLRDRHASLDRARTEEIEAGNRARARLRLRRGRG